ncbi:MAG: protein translocase subunit SecF [Methylococcales bacterium]|jgi:preprotein translocase subunit SecF|nr:protein translocase subunit SecF [Methylococcales bacterium]MBT7408237.1 protein translocase subunit SecF [Methylococcales bacterium]
MQLLATKTHFNFMEKQKTAMMISGALIIISILTISIRGFNFGIDFTGGTLIEVGFQQAAPLEKIRDLLTASKYKDASVQNFGTSREALIRLPKTDAKKPAEISEEILDILKTSNMGKIDMRRVEFVGPQVGKELKENGALAMLYALICILIYVAVRFEYRFAIGSVTALVHDVIITLGVFSVTQINFDLSVLAAILAVIGYSLNDTIVVFDRIRENFRKIRKGSPTEIINTSLNQTLSRTLMTSMTTLLVLLSLFFLGGEIIHAFAFALIIGVFIGTYSSIYIASTTILRMGISKEDLMPVEKEGAEINDMP